MHMLAVLEKTPILCFDPMC